MKISTEGVSKNATEAALAVAGGNPKAYFTIYGGLESTRATAAGNTKPSPFVGTGVHLSSPSVLKNAAVVPAPTSPAC